MSIHTSLILLTLFIWTAVSSVSDFYFKDQDDDFLRNCLLLEKPSLILFHEPISNPLEIDYLNEFDKLAERIAPSGLEINLVTHVILPFRTIPDRFVLNSLPSVKLVLEGRIFEYAGEKTALEMFPNIANQVFSRIITITEQAKLDILLTMERNLFVFFTDEPEFSPGVRNIKEIFTELIPTWGEMVRFVIAKNIHQLSFPEGFRAKSNELFLFRKQSPPSVQFKEELDVESVEGFLLGNIFAKLNILDQNMFKFIKAQRLVFLLAILKPKDADALEEELIKVSKEIGHEILIAVYWDGSNKDMDTTLQELVGSAAPFSKSQVFILDYRKENNFKFYRMDFQINEQNIRSYFNHWRNGDVKPLLRSELAQKISEDDPLPKIVGRNFEQLVMDPSYDVFVLFYFNGCGETCKQVESVLRAAAAQILNFRYFKFYKINLSLNDIPGLEVRSLPAFGAYTKDHKKLRLFTGETISTEKIVEFVKGTSKQMNEEQYESLIKQSEAAKLDEILAAQEKEQKSKRFVDIEL